MKMINPTLARIASITGFILGGFALSVVAQTAWVGPQDVPPKKNAYAPVNIGDSTQSKAGRFGVGMVSPVSMLDGSMFDVNGIASATKFKSQQLQVTGGCPGCAGKVLTADNDGNATWQDGGGGAKNPTILSKPFIVDPLINDPTSPTGCDKWNTAGGWRASCSLKLKSPTNPVKVPGAKVGDTVLIGLPPAHSFSNNSCGPVTGVVIADDLVEITFWNPSGFACTIPSGPSNGYNIRVIK